MILGRALCWLLGSGMRVEVRHFAGNSYTVHYEKNWYSLRTEWGKPDSSNWSFPSLIEKKVVCLMSFEEARELAESLSLDKIEKHEKQLREIYKKRVNEATLLLARNRSRNFTTRK